MMYLKTFLKRFIYDCLFSDFMSVILVDQRDEVIGEASKLQAHERGMLHRAFSIFVFNSQRKMLVQRRALDKYHCGGLWANTCCSHPAPRESLDAAVHRRLQEEMGFDCDLEHLGRFMYRATFENGLIEHEIDHVYEGVFDGVVAPNPAEVMDYDWLSLAELQRRIEDDPQAYTPWFKLGLQIYF
jgi:isopentenyl-diphosphate delta-isomerase